jgi:hypothetical protein
MTPYVVAVVLPRLRALHEALHAPVPTWMMAAELQVSDRHARRWLDELLDAGCAQRVGGRVGKAVKGWEPCAPPAYRFDVLTGRSGGLWRQYRLPLQ